MHTVHLFGPYGDHLALPLAALTLEHTEWAAHAVVIEDEGPLVHLERAPLNRRGMTFGLAGGYNSLDATRDSRTHGGSLRLELGGFPTQWLGILATMNVGFGERSRQTVINTRFGGELQIIPLGIGRFHAGLFGQAGWQQARRSDEFGPYRERGGYYGGGALFQLEMTTRSAVTLRGGVSTSGGQFFPEAHVGISVF